ncbi:hypothetical protein [Minwuia sp.]|uniref:hypothetical protein n=1 Tax=Minwuia sp. TaxID=2493630 RepID=UPI003A8CD969
MKIHQGAIVAILFAVSGCSSLSSVGEVFGIESKEMEAVSNYEECAAFNMAVSANLSSSVHALSEEAPRAGEFRKRAEFLMDRAVQMRMAAEGTSRAEAFKETFENYTERVKKQSVELNDRIGRDGTGVIANPWVQQNRKRCGDNRA